MWAKLDLVDGPECPDCGCPDSRVHERTTHWGKPIERRQCNHCGCPFIAPVETEPIESAEPELTPTDPNIVEYLPVHCPHCGVVGSKITRSCPPTPAGDRRTRYHKCKKCGKTFKSLEKIG